jgi:protein-S-isoprenylcysteine O-methyltransferase Ste14
MRKPVAAVVSSLFFAAAPAVVAGVIPFMIGRWQTQAPLWLPWRILGVLAIAAALPLLVHAFARFVIEGGGTPAPVAPTERLVVGGAYRYVRNPMYVAVVTTILGQALLFGDTRLLGYGVLVGLAFVGFVRVYEEPTLRRRYGEEYEAYRRAVPAWLPRLRPWDPQRH